jgi:hypothetical protein
MPKASLESSPTDARTHSGVAITSWLGRTFYTKTGGSVAGHGESVSGDAEDSRASSPALVLSASEIASFAFCPQAWHLQRRGTAQNVAGARKLERGTFAHRRIGSRVDRVRGLERLRRVTMLLLAVLLAGLVLQLLSAGGLLRP